MRWHFRFVLQQIHVDSVAFSKKDMEDMEEIYDKLAFWIAPEESLQPPNRLRVELAFFCRLGCTASFYVKIGAFKSALPSLQFSLSSEMIRGYFLQAPRCVFIGLSMWIFFLRERWKG